SDLLLRPDPWPTPDGGRRHPNPKEDGAAPVTMRIDVHAHYFAPEYIACLRRLGDPRAESRDAVPGGPPTLAQQVEVLDAVGIDLQVLSVSLLQPYLPREADAVEAARLSNDVYADATRGY